jgi:hypothetical protein
VISILGLKLQAHNIQPQDSRQNKKSFKKTAHQQPAQHNDDQFYRRSLTPSSSP